MLARFTKDHAVADIPLQRLPGLRIAEHRGGHIRWCIAESAEELIDNVIAQICALRPRNDEALGMTCPRRRSRIMGWTLLFRGSTVANSGRWSVGTGTRR